MLQSTNNVLPSVESSLPPATFELLKAIAEKASEIDMSVYLVGGSVRDLLLGTPVKDLDIVVEGNAATLAFEASKELGGNVSDYAQFGTATVTITGQRFDLATARQETYSSAGALPKVTPSTIQEDLVRRDFSINAMAIAISGTHSGQLLDAHAGVDDLRHGLIRVLHPGSFSDDATRILRAIRYQQRLDFRLEEETHRLLMQAVNRGMLDTVSGDRIRHELELMFEEEHPSLPLSRCGELGVLGAIHPPLGNGAGVNDAARDDAGNSPLKYLAALSYPFTAQEGECFIHRLRMPSRWAKVVRDTIAVRLKSGGDPSGHPHIGAPSLSSGEICVFLDQLSTTSVQINAVLSESPCVREALRLYLTEWRYIKSLLSGTDLISLGLARGPLIGEVLQVLRNARIEGKLTTRDEEMELAKEYIGVN